MRLIDVDALKAELNNKGIPYRADINEILLRMPIIDPVRHGKWIPCSERLPVQRDVFYDGSGTDRVQKSDMSLVTIGGGKRRISVDFLLNGKWVTYRNDVVAWMPLPEPYNGNENA